MQENKSGTQWSYDNDHQCYLMGTPQIGCGIVTDKEGDYYVNVVNGGYYIECFGPYTFLDDAKKKAEAELELLKGHR
jgi:hypothetical protein